MRSWRSRLNLALVVIVLVAVCLLVPSVLYFTELALRELRLFWGLLVVLAAALWLLGALKPKR